MTSRLALPALVATLVVLPAAALAAPRFVQGEVLVKFREGTPAARSAAAIAALAHTPLRTLGGGWTHVRVQAGEGVDRALVAYAADPDVEWAQPNFLYRATAAVTPDDPEYGQQWALRNGGQEVTSQLQGGFDAYFSPTVGVAGDDLDVERAWGMLTDCGGAVVAVVDTGVNYEHPDLAANMWVDPDGIHTRHGFDFVDGDADPMDLNGHGSHVAGIIGAVGNNHLGTAGVCWTARLMAIRVLDAVGSGTTASIAQGLQFAADHGATVINMSLGGEGTDTLLSSAIAAATDAGAVVVVAAGNEAVDNDGPRASYPCADPNPAVLCVAALDATFQLAAFSNYGLRTVDVGAPGVNILSTWPGSTTVQEYPYDPATFAGLWSRTSTTGTGWGVEVAPSGTAYLENPSNYISTANAGGTPHYRAGTTDRAWRTVDTSGGSVTTVEFGAAVDLARTDWFRVWCSAAGGSPFSAVKLEEDQGLRTNGYLVGFELDLARCRGASASVGVELQSTGATTSYGIAVSPLLVRNLTLSPAQPQYNTISGTSMATPLVAGVAALLRTYQPAFTAADVVGAITGGGRHVASLDGKTTSRNAVQAHGALKYVNPPRGLTFTVQ